MERSIATSFYHSVLRIALCVVAIMLVFDSGILIKQTKYLSLGAQNYLASAVGVTVGVAPTDVNQLTSRITELEQELATKEREISVRLGSAENPEGSTTTSTFILSIILFILLVLIVLNYALDYVRSEAARQVLSVR